ncbi:inner membrane I-AAA protease complex subunit Yme1 [Schizosaccharomyces japonicus yFS275]|uniref:Inner membrane I-AAA protease complex subunit Yme1 n=1 Tax=Schizosaccharomyces japonicus (strain yFS275 / FY16936) TaxID=402676 RepID=B6JYZ3_SCHJY|nr:inner membrane I-AAA protease complex subunit Yme1 [Schizosaccharomyces japonicus yFS275]EEB06761.2 inner membrane I-AAA protease complex subunit Yme1 [Schizosaccharomyces japonicus yFS275]
MFTNPFFLKRQGTHIWKRCLRQCNFIQWHKRTLTVQSFSPLRRLYTNSAFPTNSNTLRQDLAFLEERANADLYDSSEQARFYERIVDIYPEAVIKRYETKGVARDADCDRLYSLALLKKAHSLAPESFLSNTAAAVNSAETSPHSYRSLPFSKMAAPYGSAAAATTGTASANPIDGTATNNTLGSNPAPAKGPVSSVLHSQSTPSLAIHTLPATTLPLGSDKKHPLFVVMDESRFAKVFRVVRFLVGVGFITYVALVGMSILAETSGVNNLIGNNPEIEPAEERSVDVHFSDVQGVDEAKEELEEVVEFLRNPTEFTRLGGKLPRGILLTGPPGTGKTMLARAVAGEAGVPFFFMSGSQFDEMFVGVGAKRVRELFATARKHAPSIIFIDELDAIGQKRNARDAAHMRQTLNQLLVDLDGFSKDEDAAHPVIFIGATNFPESLDPALTRPGRFDRHVHVPLPDVRGRMAILRHHTQNVPLSEDVDLSVIARGTSGFAGADLANLINFAAIRASRLHSRYVGMSDMEWSKDRIIMGAERRSAFITPESKMMTAYHEGGHALVALFTRGAMRPYKATIMPRGSSLGMTVSLPDMDKDSWTRGEYMAMMDVAMGGRAAEELLYGRDNTTSGAHNDIEKATQIARKMVTEFGMSDRVGPVSLETEFSDLSPATKAVVEAEIKSLLEGSYERAMLLLKTHKKELETLARALVEYEFLTADEMQRVMKGEDLSRTPID